MLDTATLLLIQIGVQLAFLLAAAALVMRALRRTLLRPSTAEDGKAMIAEFPAIYLLVHLAFALLFVMAAFSANAWMPRADHAGPAVNSTMQGQIYRDAEREHSATPAPSTEAGNEAHEKQRKSLVNEVRREFDALPDAE